MIYSPWGHKKRMLKNPVKVMDELRGNAYCSFCNIQSQTFSHQAQNLSFNPSKMEYDDKPFVMSSYDRVNFVDTLHIKKYLSSARGIIDYIESTTSATLQIGNDLAAFAKVSQPLDREAMSIINGEMDILTKLTYLRFKRPYYYLESHQGNAKPIDDDMKFCVSKVSDALLAYGVEHLLPADSLGDPLDTAAGLPNLGKGIEGKLRNALDFEGCFSGPSSLFKIGIPGYPDVYLPNALISKLLKFADIKGWHPLTALSVTSARRAGPSRKPGSIYEYRDELVRVGEVDNMPRARQVFMNSYVYNLGLVHSYRMLKSGRKAIYSFNHPDSMRIFTAKAAFLSKKYKYGITIEMDASQFDKNIPIALREAIIHRPILQQHIPEYESGLLDLHSYLAYVSPDPNSNENGAAMIRFFRGGAGLYSGIKITSEIGSYSGISILAWIGLHTRLVTQNSIRSMSWIDRLPVLDLGDDMLMYVATDDLNTFSVIEDCLERLRSDMGIIIRVNAGCRFLMKHITPSGNFPVLARTVQQSLFNEHGRSNPLLYALGCTARFQGVSELISRLRDLSRIVSIDLRSHISGYIDAYFSLFDALRPSSRDWLISCAKLTKKELQNMLVQLSRQLTTKDLAQLADDADDLKYSESGREIISILEATGLPTLRLSEQKEFNLLRHALHITGAQSLK